MEIIILIIEIMEDLIKGEEDLDLEEEEEDSEGEEDFKFLDTHMILNILDTNHFYMYDEESNHFLIK